MNEPAPAPDRFAVWDAIWDWSRAAREALDLPESQRAVWLRFWLYSHRN